MKKLGILLVLLVTLRVAAQDDALLLYRIWENDVATIYVSNVSTGEQTKVAELLGPGGATWGDAGWSPDGRYVWVVDSLTEDTRRLRLFDAEDWSEITIAENLMMNECDASIYWSPDGQAIGYYTGVKPDHQAALVNLSSELRVTVDDPSNPDGASLYFSPDGRYLSFSAGEYLLIDVADGTITEIGGRVDRFSPDSRFLMYLDIRNNPWLYTIATGEAVNLETTALIEQWSLDGHYLVMRAFGEQANVNYFYYDTETDSFTSLETEKPIYRVLGWMHNRAELLMQTSDNDMGEQSLVRYTIASGEVTTLLESSQLVWNNHPNGDWLVVTYGIGNNEDGVPGNSIQIMHDDTVVLDTEMQLHIPFAPWASDFMRTVLWSPDGRWLILRSNDGIYRFDTETTELYRLPVDEFGDGEIGWSGDSRYLLIRVFPEDDGYSEWMMWDNVDEILSPVEYPIDTLIGWQYSDAHISLIYCGIR